MSESIQQKTQYIKNISTGIIHWLIFLSATLIIVLVSYIILYPQFSAERPVGTDALSAYTYVVHIDKFYPAIPFWYPNQGAGASFISGYPYGAHYLVAALHHITKIPLIRVFNILEFSVFPISAICIIFYCWKRIRYPIQPTIRIVIGTIASLIYLAAPITYIWATQWGFYAETVSYLFVGPSIIAIDYYLELAFLGYTGWKKRLALAFAVLFFVLTFFTHFSSGLGLVHFILAWTLAKTVLVYLQTKKIHITLALKTLGALFIPIALLLLPRMYAYTNYSKQVALGGFSGYVTDPKATIDPNSLPTIKQMLGLEVFQQPDPHAVLNYWSMPLYVWIFLVVALFLGWKINKKITLFSILGLFGLTTYTIIPVIQFTRALGSFSELINNRSIWTVYRIIIPIAAAYGIYAIGDTLTKLPDLILLKANRILSSIWKYLIRPILVLSITAAILFVTIQYSYKSLNIHINQDQRLVSVGTRYIDLNNLWGPSEIQQSDEIAEFDKEEIPRSPYYNRLTAFNICATINKDIDVSNLNTEITKFCSSILSKNTPDINQLTSIRKKCIASGIENYKDELSICSSFNFDLAYQLNPHNWPIINIQRTSTQLLSNEEIELFKNIDNNPLQTRLDISALSASSIMHTPLITDVSQTQIYINSLNLQSALWNHQSSVMYATQPLYQSPGIVTELAKWFGYEHILATKNANTPTYLYEQDSNWEKEDLSDWWRFKYPTTLATWDNRQRILFIGDNSSFIYDQLFKVASNGVFPYSDGMLFLGSKYVDSYSVEELSKFNAVYLNGYKFIDQDKGQNILTEYVKKGGGLFIETGWQYHNPDWQSKNPPEYLPSNELIWKELKNESQIKIDDNTQIKASIDDSISYLSTKNGQWGVSTPTDIRQNVHVVAHVNSLPIITSTTLGKGKIVWSGYNAIAHIEGTKFENKNEISIIRSALNWLVNNNIDSTNLSVSASRKYPDKVTFELNQSTRKNSTLYWRESYYPQWKAYLLKNKNVKQKLNVYPAGPRLMGIIIPPVQDGDRVILEVKYQLREYLYLFLAIITLGALILHISGVLSPLERNLRKIIRVTLRKMIRLKYNGEKFKIHDDPNINNE